MVWAVEGVAVFVEKMSFDVGDGYKIDYETLKTKLTSTHRPAWNFYALTGYGNILEKLPPTWK